MQLLCTLRDRRRRRSRNTRYRAARYGLTRTGLAPARPRQLCLAHLNFSQSGGRIPGVSRRPSFPAILNERFGAIKGIGAMLGKFSFNETWGGNFEISEGQKADGTPRWNDTPKKFDFA